MVLLPKGGRGRSASRQIRRLVANTSSTGYLMSCYHRNDPSLVSNVCVTRDCYSTNIFVSHSR